MRATLLLILALLLPGAATAQGWREYAYPNASFAVQLPAPPVIETGTYAAPGGHSVPATTYALRQPDIVYTMTVANLTNTPIDNERVIDQAVRALRDTGEVAVDVRAEINDRYGRKLSVNETDGSRSIYAIFYFNHHFYELKGKVLPPNPVRRSGNAIRFQESLRFIGLRGGRVGG
jgi:hypothetical protein